MSTVLLGCAIAWQIFLDILVGRLTLGGIYAPIAFTLSMALATLLLGF